MRLLFAILLTLLTFFSHSAQPELTGRRKAEISDKNLIEKVERKRSGKKGSTNEWQTARSFPLMFVKPVTSKFKR
jgi:hypothetical protein